jgi:hypothetical protein
MVVHADLARLPGQITVSAKAGEDLDTSRPIDISPNGMIRLIRMSQEMSSSDLQQQQQQRLRALELANAMRSGRARLKREIGAGAVTVAEVLRDPSPEAERCSLGELLMSQRGWGRHRCASFLVRHKVSERKLIVDLTARQREFLAQELTALA